MKFDLDARPPYTRVDSQDQEPAALKTLGVPLGRPVLVCVGGAGGMDVDLLGPLAQLIAEHVVPALVRHSAVAVDGGTDVGVMQLLGRAREASGAQFALLGVAAEGTVRLPGGEPPRPDAADLEPRHTGVLLVPGGDWGDESPSIARVADRIADGNRSVTLVINGGQITLADVENSLRERRPVIVLAGTGRTADAIADAARAGTVDPLVAGIAADPLVTVVRLDRPADLACALDAALDAALDG